VGATAPFVPGPSSDGTGGGSDAEPLGTWRAEVRPPPRRCAFRSEVRTEPGNGRGTPRRGATSSGLTRVHSMATVSAGSVCWHVGGTTDSFGPELRPVTDALGFLPFSNGVHYDAEEQRRPLFHRLVAEGTLPAGYATDNGVGLVYRGTEMVEAVTELAGPGAYHVRRGPDGRAEETRIEPRLLPGAVRR
ncbi:MAG: Type 1 glutamine amidotransferase-like domain-containing protein, partial [Candidatus Dormibacteria bacterium]